MAATRISLRNSVGYQPADAHSHRYEAPSARNITRYDAPSNGSTRRLDAPPARLTQFRAPSSRSGTACAASDARRRTEFGA